MPPEDTSPSIILPPDLATAFNLTDKKVIPVPIEATPGKNIHESINAAQEKGSITNDMASALKQSFGDAMTWPKNLDELSKSLTDKLKNFVSPKEGQDKRDMAVGGATIMMLFGIPGGQIVATALLVGGGLAAATVGAIKLFQKGKEGYDFLKQCYDERQINQDNKKLDQLSGLDSKTDPAKTTSEASADLSSQAPQFTPVLKNVADEAKKVDGLNGIHSTDNIEIPLSARGKGGHLTKLLAEREARNNRSESNLAK